jgi:tetratricopeptide (TPR) repeat protein
MTVDQAISRAWQLHQAGDFAGAEEMYRQILRLQPNLPLIWNNLAHMMISGGRFEEAIEACEAALKLQPDLAEAHVNLSQAYLATKRVDEAIIALQSALKFRPDLAEAWNNLANAHKVSDRLEEALAANQRALGLQPDWPHLHNNLGKIRQAMGDVDGAIAAFRQALKLQPNLPLTHLNLGIALLLRGEYPEGWREYEWRWRTREFEPYIRQFSKPAWDGSNLNGKTILLFAEQGFGDTIQFVRYTRLVAERGGVVVLECQKELCGVLEGVDGVSQVFARGLQPPAFDLHCPQLSLPRLFQTELSTIPAGVPYVRAGESVSKKWKSLIEGDRSRFKVGLTWVGGTSDPHRNASLDDFSPLLSSQDVCVYSLQIGPAALEAKGSKHHIVDLGGPNKFEDFADTAGLISQMDLVVTVDTAVAHLAAAMGKRVLVLLPFAADWRWLLHRADSPWYPTMRLFRQRKLGEWGKPIQEIVHELGDILSR